MDKRGISPLIATVLLIVFALVIAGMILSWGRGQVSDITEEAGEQIGAGLACTDILGAVSISESSENDAILVTNANAEGITVSGTYNQVGCTQEEIDPGVSITVTCGSLGEDIVDQPYSLLITMGGNTCGPITGTA